MQVKLIWVGKTRNPSIRALQDDYFERLRHLTPCEILETRDISRGKALSGPKLLEAEAAEILRFLPPGGRVVVLEETGKEFTSPELARWFDKEEKTGTRDLYFVIGGPDGLSPELGQRSILRLSLGRMTWTHEMCRMLLLEQLYRACSILRHIPYHK
jgi:23S rRNA (pseudouridine1915-N3)-methyltransferase